MFDSTTRSRRRIDGLSVVAPRGPPLPQQVVNKITSVHQQGVLLLFALASAASSNTITRHDKDFIVVDGMTVVHVQHPTLGIFSQGGLWRSCCVVEV